MSIEQKRFSKREWLLIVTLVVIGEYLFLESVFKYGANEGIVSYMSFAGTIVSIILAVLAIVYSYYQNFSQQRDSNSIATQVELLRNTVGDIRVSKDEFANELQRINEISDKLDQSISILAESKGHVTKLTADFSSLKSLLESSTSQKSEGSGDVQLTTSQIEKFFYACHEFIYVVLYSYYRSSGESLTVDERYRKYFWEPMSMHFTDQEYSQRTFSGMYGILRHVFFALDLFTEDDTNKITIHPDLSRLIRDEIENGDIVKDEMPKTMLERIKELKIAPISAT